MGRFTRSNTDMVVVLRIFFLFHRIIGTILEFLRVPEVPGNVRIPTFLCNFYVGELTVDQCLTPLIHLFTQVYRVLVTDLGELLCSRLELETIVSPMHVRP